MTKRAFDFLVSSFALILISPLLLVISILIKFDSKGPILYRQERVGRYGRLFHIHKFRTMYHRNENKGLLLTVGNDERITKVGSWLRKYKFDELPQLIDVCRGEMSLVGPRPEVKRYIDLYPEEAREIVLSVRPGITDNASIEFRNENQLLSDSLDPEKTYIEIILPQKIKLYINYVQVQNFFLDIKLILKTLLVLLSQNRRL